MTSLLHPPPPTLPIAPLALDALSPRLRKILAPDAPEALRLMVARAGVPLPPEELVVALYQLSLDPQLHDTAYASLRQLPAPVLQTLAATPALDPHALHALTHALLRDRPDDLAPLLLHPHLHDETLAWVALHAPTPLTERICDNQARLLQAPATIAALYHNPNTRQSSLDRVIELAMRHNIDLEALGLHPQDAAALHDGPGIDEETFTQLLSTSVAEAVSEHAAAKAHPTHDVLAPLHPAADPDDDPDAPSPAAPEKQRVGPLWQQIQNMNTAQKMRLAALGGREARELLLKDSKRVVYMAAIRNPRVDVSDAQKLAANRSLPQDIIAYIARKRDWIRSYGVVVNLINNPKCPLSEATKFLKDLRAADLQRLQKNKNIPTQLARQAAALYRQRAGG